jgi:DNA (cytosine-5)-methyltransferase 1
MNKKQQSKNLEATPKRAHERSKPAIYSFFSGAGFLDLGFELAGFEIQYVNEIHQPFLAAYQHSRKQMGITSPINGYFAGDIQDCLDGHEGRKIKSWIKNAKVKKQITGFIGGPPCPDFSIGGKNRGQHGENGRLSKTYADLISKHKPDFFVFENVIE